MLLHLPRLQGWGVEPRMKNGPALAGYGAGCATRSLRRCDKVPIRVGSLSGALLHSTAAEVPQTLRTSRSAVHVLALAHH